VGVFSEHSVNVVTRRTSMKLKIKNWTGI